MSGIDRTGLAIAAVVAISCLIALGSMGTVLGENPSHEVDIEPPDPVVEDDGQTIQVTVENLDDENDMAFPLVEIQLRDGLNVSDEHRSPDPNRVGDSFGNVVVEFEDGTEETRLAYIDDSSYRNSEAIFIEGENLPAGESKTYEFDLTVETSSEVQIEVDVRPLNQEENNVREIETVDPVGTATIDAAFEQADNSVTVDGITENGSVETKVLGQQTYDVSADVSLLPEELTVDLTPEENTIEVVRFSDIEAGEADDPVVIARTGSTAEVISASTAVSFETGNAETNATQDVEVDLTVSSGEAHIVIEDRDESPLRGIESKGNFDNAEFVETGQQGGVALFVQDGEVDDVKSIELIGYPLGDVTLSGEVNADDADAIATAAAGGDTLPEYGDVTGDGDISAVDAMKVKQYDENNRNAEYEVSG